jgi:hypothetical protein
VNKLKFVNSLIKNLIKLKEDKELLICKLFELKALLQDLKFKITEQEIAEIL